MEPDRQVTLHHHHAGENVVLWHDHEEWERLGDGVMGYPPSGVHHHDKEPPCRDKACSRNQ